MKVNTKVPRQKVQNFEGTTTFQLTPEQELDRAVLSCMLFEGTFYESGKSIEERIRELVHKCNPVFVYNLAVTARERMNLRHVPLLIAREMARGSYRHKAMVGRLLERIIMRPDEISEYVALYMMDGKQPLSNQSKVGLRNAFYKFDEYQFAKYRGDGKMWSLRDVMFLVHPKPRNKEEVVLFRNIANNTLATPDTWEVNISRNDGVSKRDKWERLLSENRMGGLAVLRNLRNFQEAKVDERLIRSAINNINSDRILPFRYIAAAKAAPRFERELEAKFIHSFAGKSIRGRADILVDVSVSMDSPLSSKSEMKMLDAAYGVAMIGRELFDRVNVFSFSRKTVEVPARHGFALRDAIDNSQMRSGTNLGAAVYHLSSNFVPDGSEISRLIVVTDEQSSDTVDYRTNYDVVYVINVAPYRFGVDYSNGIHINGFSEAVFDWIREYERLHRK